MTSAVVRLLVIVSRARPDLHAYIRRVFFTDLRLQVFVDRRRVVRRRTFDGAGVLERRRKERRGRLEIDDQIRLQGWTVVPVRTRQLAD